MLEYSKGGQVFLTVPFALMRGAGSFGSSLLEESSSEESLSLEESLEDASCFCMTGEKQLRWSGGSQPFGSLHWR